MINTTESNVFTECLWIRCKSFDSNQAFRRRSACPSVTSTVSCCRWPVAARPAPWSGRFYGDAGPPGHRAPPEPRWTARPLCESDRSSRPAPNCSRWWRRSLHLSPPLRFLSGHRAARGRPVLWFVNHLSLLPSSLGGHTGLLSPLTMVLLMVLMVLMMMLLMVLMVLISGDWHKQLVVHLKVCRQSCRDVEVGRQCL